MTNDRSSMNLSRLTIELDARGVAFLAAEGLHRRKLGTHYTVVCTDGSPTKVALKHAAEAIAARTAAAQLPFFITPSDLIDALSKLGIADDLAAEAVAQVVVSAGIKEAAEQHRDDHAATILTSHLVAVPQLGGLQVIRPTADAAPTSEPSVDTRQDRPENPVGRGDYPDIDAAKEDLS
jgi:hypothetical protein